eukprot:scaffold27210_cov31-Attheya_sp.AAC.5
MEHHPIASNSLLCFNLWIAGDVLAQYSEHRMLQDQQKNNNGNETAKVTQDSHDSATAFTGNYSARRTAECASYGAFFTGPLIATGTWYPYMEKLCARYQLVTARYGIWAALAAKVLANEFLMDPPTLVAFYGYMNICEGGKWESFQQKLHQEFLRSWLTSLAVWPVVLLGTFRYLPVYAQAPLINACCIVWDGFLSHRNAAARLQQQEQQQF